MSTSHDIYCADSLVAWTWPDVDAIVTNPPYSERCHAGHDKAKHDGRDGTFADRKLAYECWTATHVARAVQVWLPHCRGWFVVMSDHVLAYSWATSLERMGRYVFAPIPWVAPGSRVRLQGDGPSSWTCWITVARPRNESFAKWGTLPGAYVIGAERGGIVGGKPVALLKALVSDYSWRGDRVGDPCCGSGALGRAAMDCGRSSLQVDVSPEHCELARKRLAQQTLEVV